MRPESRPRGTSRWPVLVGLALLAVAAPGRARAGTEEWSTFDVIAQEEDDESLIDHLLTRPPTAWRDEWERSARAFRTSQGCLTSGQWLVDTDLKLRSAMGTRARFGLDVREEEGDRASFTYFDLSFRGPTRWGTPGFWFRPFHDKSRQDFSVFWEAGAETAAAFGHVAFTFEDAFNNLWAFRQTRVGNASESYERHPYEPAVALRVSGERGRAELEGQWLTPSRKRLEPVAPGVEPRVELWGVHGRAAAELSAGGWRVRATSENRQARSSEELAGPAGVDYRRQWSAETGLQRGFGDRLELEAGWIYQGRDERSEAPYPSQALEAVDRVLQLEGRWSVRPTWVMRAGLLHDRITLGREGSFRTYGTRVESRAYVGMWARFGQVALSAVEGIEFDPEPYDVWGVHDKAFLHIQTTF